MPKRKSAKPKVILSEWDGDRSSSLGGLTLLLSVAGQELEQSIGSYDTSEERANILIKGRKTAKKVASALGIGFEENLFG